MNGYQIINGGFGGAGPKQFLNLTSNNDKSLLQNTILRLCKLKNVEVIDPLPHKELLEVMSECRLVITDSGGIQEESSFLKKKSVVCRKATERVEGLGTFSFLCQEPEHLKGLFNRLNKNPEIDLPCPYGDGKSSQKIYEILNR